MSNIPEHHLNSTKTLFGNPWDAQTREEECNEISPNTSNSSWLQNLNILPSILTDLPVERAKDFSNHKIISKIVVKPDFSGYLKGGYNLKATWLGHASFLVQLPCLPETPEPIRILFDPMFSDVAGPSAWTGIKRYLPPPCPILELPDYQYVLISHNHYDHLDLPTIREIARVREYNVKFLVPLGLKKWFVGSGVPSECVYEMDWWDETDLQVVSKTPQSPIVQTMKFICVPAQHTSGRFVADNSSTLWCGWIVRRQSSKNTQIYYAGDTGYLGDSGPCPVFKEIGERYGPFDLSLLPIWRGGTLSLVSRMGFRLTHRPYFLKYHASPADAVAMHKDVRSRHSLAMHFGTFVGSDTEAREALIELAQAREELQVGDWYEEGGFGAIDIGETIEIEPDSKVASTEKSSP